MSAESNFLDVQLLGREYRVACPPDEREALLAAVALVDEQVKEITARSRSGGAERVAVMAALNLAHELLSLRRRPSAPEAAPGAVFAAVGEGNEGGFDTPDFQRRIGAMEAKLDEALRGKADSSADAAPPRSDSLF